MAKVKFLKTTEDHVSSLPIVEGQLIFTTDEKNIYWDTSSNSRIAMGGGEEEVYIGTSTPTDPDAKIWIDPTETANPPSEFAKKTDIPTKTSDLTNDDGFITATNYASTSAGGTIKTNNGYATDITSAGSLKAQTKTYNDYNNADNGTFVGKGTLENVLTGKGYTTNIGTITSIKMNGTTISTGGEANLGTVVTNVSNKQDIFQYSTMPSASSTTVGKIVQYIGTTNSNYTNGYFYIGKNTSGTYTWENINVQEGGGAAEIPQQDTAPENPSENDLWIDTSSDEVTRTVCETLPVGTILPFADSTIPDGYMLCDGSALSRTEYAGLFAIIGTTYGVGDGSTTFNLPNLKGRVPVGCDSTDTEFDTLGEIGGEKTHTLVSGELPAHTHSTTNSYSNIAGTGPAGGSTKISTGSTYYFNYQNSTGSVGSDQAHNNLQPYIVINYIIKVAQTTVAAAQTINSYSTSSIDAYSANYINNALLDIYSTNETLTNKIWMNNPVYRKVIYISSLPNNTSTTYQIFNDTTNINDVWINEADSYIKSGNENLPINYIWDTSGYVMSSIINKELRIKTTDNKSSALAYITVEYTKSTD